MRFYQLILKNVLQRKARSALTMIGVAVAVTAVVALVGIADGFERSFRRAMTLDGSRERECE